jgi:hypothetical protein
MHLYIVLTDTMAGTAARSHAMLPLSTAALEVSDCTSQLYNRYTVSKVAQGVARSSPAFKSRLYERHTAVIHAFNDTQSKLLFSIILLYTCEYVDIFLACTGYDCRNPAYAACSLINADSTHNMVWIGDGVCDSYLNNHDCQYDMGDCCVVSTRSVCTQHNAAVCMYRC